MPHIHLHEVFTACAHARFLDTVSVAPLPTRLHSHSHSHSRTLQPDVDFDNSATTLQHLQSVLVYHEAVFRFGWCPSCTEHVASPRCRQGRPAIPLRSVAVLRSFWRYKALNHMDAAVPAYEIPYSAYLPPSSPPNSTSTSSNASSDEYLPWDRDTQRSRKYALPFGESALLWEERALWRTVRDLKPQQVHLGPLLFRLPILEDGLRNMLRGARQWTVLWAKGDEALYKKDPGLDLNRPWDPAREEAWEIERFYQPYRPLGEKLRGV